MDKLQVLKIWLIEKVHFCLKIRMMIIIIIIFIVSPKLLTCNLKRQPDLVAQVGALHKFLSNRNQKGSKEYSIKVN